MRVASDTRGYEMDDSDKVVHLPRCEVSGCETVATRAWYTMTVDDQAEDPIKLCWRHELEFGLDENEIYETEGTP